MNREQVREAAEEIGNIARDADWRDAAFKATVILLLHDIRVAIDAIPGPK